MSRWIDAEWIRNIYADFKDYEGRDDWTTPISNVLAVIDDAPSIDLDTDVWCEDCKEYDKEHHNCPRFNRVIRTALEDADMVRVVRCKECKWAEPNRDGDLNCKCHIPIFRVLADDFCSMGERREP